MNPTRYPLAWPSNWKRIQTPQYSKFKPNSPYAEAQDVHRELSLMKAKNIVISSNMQYRADGMPYSRQNVSDTGVAVYFTVDGNELCIPCDKWYRLEDNIHAIALTINALRGLDRWGAKDMVDAAFRGFTALPASIITEAPRDWWDVLEVPREANIMAIETAYKKKLFETHPDTGGSAEAFDELQKAYRKALNQ